MNRNELEKFISDNYVCTSDFPWMQYPSFRVFRHPNNKKWFAVIMDIPKNKIGLPSDDIISVVNLKSDPIMVGSLLRENGIFPAYHMTKSSWISVALDGSADEEKIKMLLDMSFEATAVKLKKKTKNIDF
ncbi:MmcQ/YjbR family DNA-binding protein [uncultured Eubacterium sp.]|uniref:MmcQ/YjbR family DNA-binding protein n=1 Tax=uncultured Eubacterium sp. TaxID=165185 RepID=UPI0025857B05|nr:MmcQ/YjbR family DNA-binding protein [uncultured Eubacterium sp.]